MDKRNVLDRLFPARYPFYEMIDQQAKANGQAVNALYRWLNGGSDTDGNALLQTAADAENIRKRLEKNLIEAFTTPFDRADIYSLSSGMDKIIQYTKSTLLSMKAYEVSPDGIIIDMVGSLKEGTAVFYTCAKDLKENPAKSEETFAKMRDTHVRIERLYLSGMTAVFKSDDPMRALRQREVYHHIKDASVSLEDTVDILHRVVVRLT